MLDLIWLLLSRNSSPNWLQSTMPRPGPRRYQEVQFVLTKQASAKKLVNPGVVDPAVSVVAESIHRHQIPYPVPNQNPLCLSCSWINSTSITNHDNSITFLKLTKINLTQIFVTRIWIKIMIMIRIPFHSSTGTKGNKRVLNEQPFKDQQ